MSLQLLLEAADYLERRERGKLNSQAIYDVETTSVSQRLD